MGGSRRLPAYDIVKLPAHDVVMDVELVEDLRGDIVIVPEERQEQMLGSDDV